MENPVFLVFENSIWNDNFPLVVISKITHIYKNVDKKEINFVYGTDKTGVSWSFDSEDKFNVAVEYIDKAISSISKNIKGTRPKANISYL